MSASDSPSRLTSSGRSEIQREEAIHLRSQGRPLGLAHLVKQRQASGDPGQPGGVGPEELAGLAPEELGVEAGAQVEGLEIVQVAEQQVVVGTVQVVVRRLAEGDQIAVV